MADFMQRLAVFLTLLALVLPASSFAATAHHAGLAVGPGGGVPEASYRAVADPVFSVSRGFYTAAQLVSIRSATVGASIRYTSDGSTPSDTVGTLYTGPIRVTRTTPLRAIAYQANFASSIVITHTYIFVEDVIFQSAATTQTIYGFPASWQGVSPDYGMDHRVRSRHNATIRNDLKTVPSLSIVMETDDLFGSKGIYSHSLDSGVAWERATSLELIDPANPGGGSNFQINCGIRIYGGYFRSLSATKKKSFRVLFKSIYGPTKLEYPMFGPDAAQQFDTLVFRMESNDGYQWGNRTTVQYARDEFSRRSQLDMGSPAGHGRHMHIYINGVYWGLYNVVERPDSSFGDNYFGADRDEWDGVNSGVATNNGNLVSWNWLLYVTKQIQSAPSEAARTALYMAVQGLNPDGSNNAAKADFINIDNYIDYLLVNWYTGNADWPRKNYYHGRERDLLDNPPNAGSRTSEGTHFFSWDAEWSLFMNSSKDQTNQTVGVAEPYGYLRRSKEFRVRVGDRVHRALWNGGALTEQRCLDRYDEITKDHPSILLPELARWGDQHGVLRTFQNWNDECQHIRKDWLLKRTTEFRILLRAVGLYPLVKAPKLNQYGGTINPGFTVQVSNIQGQAYFTLDGSDPRAIGGAIAATATSYSSPIKLDVSKTVKVRSRSGANWSALVEARFQVDVISINELLAINQTGIQDPAGEREDWIELHNRHSLPMSIGGMYLTDTPSRPRLYRVPTGQVLQPGATVLIWADKDLQQGPLHAGFKLSGSGERVFLYDTDGTLLDRVDLGAQVDDVSTGRLHDGRSHLVTFPDPTPAAANANAICGSRRYSSLDPTSQTLGLQLSGTPGLGRAVIVQARGGAATGHRVLLVSSAAGEFPLGITGSRLLLAPNFLVAAVKPVGPAGAADFSLTVPTQAFLIGELVYLQAWGLGSGPWAGSTGLEIKICK
jgi:hypothetical protein